MVSWFVNSKALHKADALTAVLAFVGLAIGIAAKVYRAIGTKIVRCNYEWWGGRQVTSGPEKLIASAKSLPLLISRRKKPGFHDFNLHSPLKDIKSVQKLCRLA